jgi:diguanylate cyclase (GGDEF)-like protein
MNDLMKEPDLVTSVANILEENSIYIQHLMTCVEIGKALTSTFNMDQILIIILKRLSELIKAKNWTLFLLDPETEELYFGVVVGLDKGALADVRIGLGEGIAGTVALTGEPILVPEVRQDTRFSNRVDDLTGFVTHSIICLPLKMQGAVIGVIELVNPEDMSLFQDNFMPLLSILADYVAIAIHNARTYRKIESLSITDDVTGYNNTRYMHQHLDQLLHQGQEVSLVFLDVDNFKEVVDSHGHLLGSRILGDAAQIIASKLEENDRLVRYGGDEFVIILPGQDKHMAFDKVVAVRKALADATFLEDMEIQVLPTTPVMLLTKKSYCRWQTTLFTEARIWGRIRSRSHNERRSSIS